MFIYSIGYDEIHVHCRCLHPAKQDFHTDLPQRRCYQSMPNNAVQFEGTK
jgi:hypothetical protein